MDADFSHNPSDIPRLLQALTDGADVALGSRFVTGGRIDYRGWRRVLSMTANWLARNLMQLPLMEYTNSFRAVCLDKVPFGLIENTDNNGYGFFLTETVYLARQGLRIVEVPTHFRDRNAGRSKMPRLQIVLGAVILLRLTLQRRPLNPGDATLDAQFECKRCDSPYVVTQHSGARICLLCMNGS
jgi:dolichol-phosphate mannosyltransferase